MTQDKASAALAVLTVLLLTAHVAQDVVYGIEAGDISDFIAALIAGVWLYGALALAGRRAGYVVLLIGSFLAPVVSLAHMAGDGVGEDVRVFAGAAFFVWTLLAVGVTATVSCLLSIHSLWRLRCNVLSFVVWTIPPVAAGGALLGFIVYQLYLK